METITCCGSVRGVCRDVVLRWHHCMHGQEGGQWVQQKTSCNGPGVTRPSQRVCVCRSDSLAPNLAVCMAQRAGGIDFFKRQLVQLVL